MNFGYADIIHGVSYALFSAIWERERDLDQKVHDLDGEVNKLLHRVGFQEVSMLLAQMSIHLTEDAKATGLFVKRHKRVKYSALFGGIEVESPNLWDKETG